jgi:DNA-binding MarR family transcriptional regulator
MPEGSPGLEDARTEGREPEGRAAEGPPDFAILVVGADRCVVDRLQATLHAAGHEEMRSPYGFVIRALAAGGLRLTALAERLGVTKQAALKVVDEMEARALVARAPAPGDRRAKLIQLTPRGQAVRRKALAASEQMEAELRADLGDADVDAARRVLLRFIERHGRLDDALDRRARPVW